MRSRPLVALVGRRTLVGLALVALLALLPVAPAHAAFHLNEITKVLVGLNGNTTIQAVELKMLANGEHFVTGVSIKVYDAAGMKVDSLGTFTGSVGVGLTGRSILCATHNFAATFGITPDLVIKPGLLVGTGQVSFETASCLVNALAYGSVTAPKNGTTSAPALTDGAATALVRSIDDPTFPSCPLSEDAAARFQLVSGTSASPITFRNNAGASVQVFPNATGVEGGPSGSAALRAYPNPFYRGARIVAPGSELVAIFDVRGRMVRSWERAHGTPSGAGPRSLQWDGTDAQGAPLPSGAYFVRYGGSSQTRARIVLLR